MPALRAELLRLETALASRDGSGVEGGLAFHLPDDLVELGASGTVWDITTTRRLLAPQP